MALQVVAQGAAGGVNVIIISVEILRTGIGGVVSMPNFTPEGIALAAKWMLLAVFSYWILCAVMRVIVALLQRGFWMLKVIMLLWIFSWIISDPKASPETTLGRLFLLAMVVAVLSVATRGRRGTGMSSVESQLKGLEGRMAVVEKKSKPEW